LPAGPVGRPVAVLAIINILPKATTLDVRFGRLPDGTAATIAADMCQHSLSHAANILIYLVKAILDKAFVQWIVNHVSGTIQAVEEAMTRGASTCTPRLKWN
jgi:hypothetical protein